MLLRLGLCRITLCWHWTMHFWRCLDCLKFEVNTVHITLVVCFIIYEYHSFLPFYSIVLFTLSLNYYLFEEKKSEYSKKGNFCRGKIFSSWKILVTFPLTNISKKVAFPDQNFNIVFLYFRWTVGIFLICWCMGHLVLERKQESFVC